MTGSVRMERDTFGEIAVPADRLWGAQTQRSLQNFRISTEKQSPELIRALATVKRAAATVNAGLGQLAADKAKAKRMDGCAAVAAYISPEKARTAALGQRGSGGYEKMINDGRTAFLCVDVLKGTLEGGLPIVIDGQVAGAVGVSGVKPNEDLEVAQAAVDAIVAGA